MRKIPEEIIEQANQYLVEIIGQYVDLKKRGGNYVGLSPFHSERTPSFVVSESKQIWKDFSSGKGGKGPISFIMEMEGLRFFDSVKKACELTGLEFSYEQDKESLDLYTAMNEYVIFLKKKMNKNIINYLHSRGINDESIEKWNIGYAPSYSEAMSFIESSKYKKELQKLGVAGYDVNKKVYYPRFYKRVMFPITNPYGQTVGFSGRSLDPNAKAKYVNTPETEHFYKSKILFGMDKVPKGTKKIIVVEGQIDVILAHQSGFNMVVAAQGTGFTQYQYNLIKDMNVFVSLDGDSAGQKATLRIVNTCLINGKVPRVVLLPKDKDVADILLEQGPEYYLGLLKVSMDSITFALRLKLSMVKNIEEEVKVMRNIKKTITKYPNPVQERIMDEYVALTKGNDNIRTNKRNYSIPLHIQEIIGYGIINFKKGDLDEIRECVNKPIRDDFLKGIETDINIKSDEEYQELLKILLINCWKQKILSVQRDKSKSFQEKKELIKEFERKINERK